MINGIKKVGKDLVTWEWRLVCRPLFGSASLAAAWNVSTVPVGISFCNSCHGPWLLKLHPYILDNRNEVSRIAQIHSLKSLTRRTPELTGATAGTERSEGPRRRPVECVVR